MSSPRESSWAPEYRSPEVLSYTRKELLDIIGPAWADDRGNSPGGLP